MQAPRSGAPPVRWSGSEVSQVIGRGASATVSRVRLAERIGTWSEDQEVALKRAAPGDADAAQAFAMESRLLFELEHDALLPLIAHGVEPGGAAWMILPLLGGPTLEELQASGGLPEKRLRAIAIRLSGALSVLHGHGWVHGDIKPQNVRFDDQGQAFLLDLGFAAKIGSPFGERGTPGYLAPEILAARVWDTPGDIFALGICLYSAATGEHPVPSALEQGEHAPVVQRFSRQDARRPSRIAGSLSPAFDQWLAQAMDPDPALRPTCLATRMRMQTAAPWPMLGSEPAASNPWSSALRLPFAGRGEELKAFEQFAQQALNQAQPGLIVVNSPAGGGGSRLLSEAARRARRLINYPTLLTGRLSNFHEERPGHALRGMLRQWLALPPHATPRAQDRERLEELLPPSAAQALIESLAPESDRPSSLAEPQALTAFFVQLAQRQPLWIQLDDADFGGRASLEPLERLAAAVQGSPVVLAIGIGTRIDTGGDQDDTSGVATAEETTAPPNTRALTSLLETWELHARKQVIELGPLSVPNMLEAVRAIFLPDQVSRKLAQVLRQRTDGHAGRLRELLRSLEAHGKIQSGPRGLRLLIEPEQIPIPPSKIQAISQRYKRLPNQKREWLVRFAVAGRQLGGEWLARAFGCDKKDIDHWVGVLVREGWLERSAAGPRFRRPQVRRALLRATPKARRQRLHWDLAQAMQTKAGAPFVVGVAFERAWHLQAGEHFQALLQLLPRLIRTAQRTGHPSRMLLLARWGLQALTNLDRKNQNQRAVYLSLGARAAHELGKRDEERQFLAELSQLHWLPERDPLQLGILQMQLGRFHAATSDRSKAEKHLQQARTNFQRAEAKELEAEALLDYGNLCLAAGHAEQAAEAMQTARRMGLRSPERARALVLSAHLALLEDRLEDAMRHLNLAKRMLAGDERRRARARSAEAELLRSRCYRLLGRARRAWASLGLAERLANQAGERALEIEVFVRRGRLLTEFGMDQEAELDLREGLRLAEAIDDRHSRVQATLLLGILLGEGGRQEGYAHLNRALAMSQEFGFPRMEALASTLCARIALRQNNLDRAQALCARSLYLIKAAGAELQDRLVALCTAHLVQKARGRDSASRTLRQAHRARIAAFERLESPLLQQRHRRSYRALMRGALTLHGPLYPRTPARDLPGLQ